MYPLKPGRYRLFREFIALCYTNRMEHISAWCGKTAGFLMLDLAVRLHTNSWSLKVLKIFFVILHTCVYVSVFVYTRVCDPCIR